MFIFLFIFIFSNASNVSSISYFVQNKSVLRNHKYDNIGNLKAKISKVIKKTGK